MPSSEYPIPPGAEIVSSKKRFSTLYCPANPSNPKQTIYMAIYGGSKAPIRLSGGGKVLFSENVKPGMFGQGIALKETFLVYASQLVFLIIRNVVMVAIDMCGKSPITGEWIYGIT